MADLSPDPARRFDLEPQNGVVVTAVAPNSPADEAGLQPGDVIAQANRKPVRNLSNYRKALAGAADPSRLLLLVQRRGQSAFVALHRAP